MQPQPPAPSPYGPPQGANPYQVQPATPGPNPYAAPRSDLGASYHHHPMTHGLITVEGQAIKFEKGTALPDRCIKCNEPAHGYRLQKKMHWHPPWLAALIILGGIGLIVAVILMFVLRKSADLAVPLCEKHRKRRINGMVVGWVGALAGMGSCTAGIPTESPAMIILGMMVFLGALIASIVMQPLRLQKIDDTHVWLVAGEPFRLSIRQTQHYVPAPGPYGAPPPGPYGAPPPGPYGAPPPGPYGAPAPGPYGAPPPGQPPGGYPPYGS